MPNIFDGLFFSSKHKMVGGGVSQTTIGCSIDQIYLQETWQLRFNSDFEPVHSACNYIVAKVHSHTHITLKWRFQVNKQPHKDRNTKGLSGDGHAVDQTLTSLVTTGDFYRLTQHTGPLRDNLERSLCIPNDTCFSRRLTDCMTASFCLHGFGFKLWPNIA